MLVLTTTARLTTIGRDKGREALRQLRGISQRPPVKLQLASLPSKVYTSAVPGYLPLPVHFYWFTLRQSIPRIRRLEVSSNGDKIPFKPSDFSVAAMQRRRGSDPGASLATQHLLETRPRRRIGQAGGCAEVSGNRREEIHRVALDYEPARQAGGSEAGVEQSPGGEGCERGGAASEDGVTVVDVRSEGCGKASVIGCDLEHADLHGAGKGNMSVEVRLQLSGTRQRRAHFVHRGGVSKYLGIEAPRQGSPRHPLKNPGTQFSQAATST